MKAELATIAVPKVTLAAVGLPSVSLRPEKKRPAFWGIANFIWEDGSNVLTENGGALCLEQKVKIYKDVV